MTCTRRKFFSSDVYRKILIFSLLLPLMLLSGIPASRFAAGSASAAESAPLSPGDRLPDAIKKLLGKDWYGIYLQGYKVGYATVVFDRARSPDSPEYRSSLVANMTLHSQGNALQLQMDVSWRFDGKAPYRLIDFINRMKTGSDKSEIKILRDNNNYRALIHQGGEVRRIELDPFDLTLDEVLAITIWIQQDPEIGAQISFADLNHETLHVGRGSAKLLKKESTMVNGIQMPYFTVLQKPASGPDITTVFGADGKPFTMSVGGAFNFKLEPEVTAASMHAYSPHWPGSWQSRAGMSPNSQ